MEETGRVGGAGLPAGTRMRRAVGGFVVRDEQAGETQPEPEVVAAAPLALGMVALQEIGETAEREARRHGERLLTALAALQRALLAGGGADAAMLRQVVDAVPCGPACSPLLQALVMRARIELARRGG